MATRLQVTIDCAKPEVLTRFWARALGYRPADPPTGYDSWTAYYVSMGVPADELGDGDNVDAIVDPDGIGPRIWFQTVPEGKVVKNRVHLDLDVTDRRSQPVDVRRVLVRAEADRLVGEGATVLTVHEPEGIDYVAITLQDPEGNEFCVG
jgi:hypothetical protein